MKRFKGFVIKEFFHIIRDVRSMLIIIGMPIVQVLIFGFAITNEIKDVQIAIIDNSKDEVSREITQKLLSSEYFLLNSNLSDYNEIEESFRGGKIKEVIIFENDFAFKLQRDKSAQVQIIADASDPNMANIVVNYTASILKDYQRSYMAGKYIPVTIVPEIKMLYNEELKSVFMFLPRAITILLMLISAMMTSISIAREKELGTMEVLLVSPLKPMQIILGKVFPYIILGFINAVTILLLGYYVFGMPVQGNMILLLLEVLLFIIMALSLGILISTIAKTQQTAMIISLLGLMLPTILLSGFIFPLENMPIILQLIANLMPPKWFIIIIKAIMLKGIGIAFIWKETLILLGMTVIFIGLSVRNFKVRLE
ncbi:MAG: ABC transporter permease [Bacteroidales bacterium]|nr:ABC transporter permease [Bacteroidales bacterium]